MSTKQVKFIRATVATAGTAVQLSTTAKFASSMLIQGNKATAANSGDVFLGNSTVDKASAIMLELRNDAPPLEFPIPHGKRIDLSKLYIDATNSADSVIVMYVE